MVGALVDLELAEQLSAEGVVGQHPLNGFFDDPLRQASLEMGEALCLHATGAARVAAIELLGGLVATHPNLVGIDHHHEITGIEVGGVSGLVFAPQHLGHFTGQTAEGLVGGINHVPLTVEGGEGRRSCLVHCAWLGQPLTGSSLEELRCERSHGKSGRTLPCGGTMVVAGVR